MRRKILLLFCALAPLPLLLEAILLTEALLDWGWNLLHPTNPLLATLAWVLTVMGFALAWGSFYHLWKSKGPKHE